MTSFILDTALTMAWCFPEEATPYTEGILTALSSPHEIFVPLLWRYEVANVLLLAVRRGRIPAAKAHGFAEALAGFHIVVDNGLDLVFPSVYTLAETYRLTCYDAAYLELALRRKLPLATLDADLRTAANACRVPLLGI